MLPGHDIELTIPYQIIEYDWNENEYENFIGKLPQEVGSFYMTINANQKGKFTSINRNNIETLKNDFNYLCKLFTNILSSMIIDGKKKLFIKEN